MRRAVLWDSSAILALLDADDSEHKRAVVAATRVAREARPCFVTNYIEAETHALLLRKLGRAMASQWLLEGGLPVLFVSLAEVARAKELLVRHDDKDWSLCDAVSFAVMESRGVRLAFTFDHHFRQHGRFELLGIES
jgi:uncharacterized protein